MSETEAAAVVNPPPKSSLSDLRQFRINKNAATSGQIARVPGKKRIQVLADSDSDGAEVGNTPKKTKVELTVKEKEERFLAAAKISTDYDTMDIQDALLQNSWDVSSALRHLKEKCTPKNRSGQIAAATSSLKPGAAGTVATSNGSSRHHSSKSKKSTHYDSDESADGAYSKGQVYDSEDSDAEETREMTGQRKKVFEFMNTASIIELQTVKTLSEKKASLISELRPFKDWADLRKKLESNKALSAELLNNAQELINKQNNVANILTKCNKLVQRLEASFINRELLCALLANLFCLV